MCGFRVREGPGLAACPLLVSESSLTRQLAQSNMTCHKSPHAPQIALALPHVWYHMGVYSTLIGRPPTNQWILDGFGLFESISFLPSRGSLPGRSPCVDTSPNNGIPSSIHSIHPSNRHHSAGFHPVGSASKAGLAFEQIYGELTQQQQHWPIDRRSTAFTIGSRQEQ